MTKNKSQIETFTPGWFLFRDVTFDDVLVRMSCLKYSKVFCKKKCIQRYFVRKMFNNVKYNVSCN